MLQTSELHPGQRVRLSHFGQSPTSYQRRLLAMGLHPGITVTLVRVAPLGCPLYFQVGDMMLILRKQEAASLGWETL